MDLNQWRSARRAELDLPSGLHVTVRRVALQTLLLTGQIPKPVLGMIAEFAESDELNLDLSDIRSIVKYLDKLPSLIEMINVVVKHALLDPAVADEADETHLAVSELEFEDRQFIFDFLSKGANAIAPFLEQSGRSESAGRARTEVSPATVGVSGN